MGTTALWHIPNDSLGWIIFIFYYAFVERHPALCNMIYELVFRKKKLKQCKKKYTKNVSCVKVVIFYHLEILTLDFVIKLYTDRLACKTTRTWSQKMFETVIVMIRFEEYQAFRRTICFAFWICSGHKIQYVDRSIRFEVFSSVI